MENDGDTFPLTVLQKNISSVTTTALTTINSMLNTSVEPDPEPTITELALLGSIFTLIILFGSVGNLLVVLAVFNDQRLHTVTNYFIVSLAFSDLAVCLGIMPFAVVTHLRQDQWVFGQEFCTIWTSADILCCTASIFNLCAISLDRYWAITTPFTYHQKMSSQRCALIIAFIWIFSTILAVAQVLWRYIIESEDELRVCMYTMNKEYRVVSSMSSFFVPLAIMLFTYCRIFRIAWMHARRIRKEKEGLYRSNQHRSNSDALEMTEINGTGKRLNSMGSHQHVDSDMEMDPTHHKSRSSLKLRLKELKAAKTLAIVMGAFVICWLPFFVQYVLEPFCPTCYVSVMVQSVFLWMGYFNSTLNPVIYVFFNSMYRDAFLKLLFSRENRNRFRHPFKSDKKKSTKYQKTTHNNHQNYSAGASRPYANTVITYPASSSTA